MEGIVGIFFVVLFDCDQFVVCVVMFCCSGCLGGCFFFVVVYQYVVVIVYVYFYWDVVVDVVGYYVEVFELGQQVFWLLVVGQCFGQFQCYCDVLYLQLFSFVVFQCGLCLGYQCVWCVFEFVQCEQKVCVQVIGYCCYQYLGWVWVVFGVEWCVFVGDQVWYGGVVEGDVENVVVFLGQCEGELLGFVYGCGFWGGVRVLRYMSSVLFGGV